MEVIGSYTPGRFRQVSGLARLAHEQVEVAAVENAIEVASEMVGGAPAPTIDVDKLVRGRGQRESKGVEPALVSDRKVEPTAASQM